MIQKIWEHQRSLGKVFLAMYILTAILLLVLAAMVRPVGMGDGGVTIGICVIWCISCFFGGFLAGKVKKSRKFLWGLLMGLSYVVLMILITFIVKQRIEGGIAELIINFSVCLGSGMLGGMVS